jgi:hypothetical protein
MSEEYIGVGNVNTKVMKCTCEHAYQDEKYGKKQRLHNKKAEKKGYRCTVCATEKGSF